MANVNIKFNNKDFLLSCEDGQEEHLEELLIQINKRFNDLKSDLNSLATFFNIIYNNIRKYYAVK